ncbi:interleukin-2 receptor subunit alpha isoform X1 [Heliangelus exortis]|uniref:interleukin-2 receptor subunit alpha isoform X1 n=1 Tax=Heliangelus exortis TaxID=472823 RepID=UPI003A8D0956
MDLKCLLMWLLLGSIKGNKPEECPALPRTDFADVAAESYPLGTKLFYECDEGYTRRRGQYLGIWCQRKEGVASWVYKDFQCIDEKLLSSSTMDLDFTQKPENKTQSPASQKQGNISEFDQKDFCGPPRTVPHASLSLNKQYYVGQVLNFKCQEGYDKQPPTSGTRTCKKVNGKIIWTSFDMRCTNDSSHRGEWPPETAEPDSTHPFFTSSVALPVTAVFFVLLIIPAVFG